MDQEADLMNQEPNEIRQDIDETRSALTQKLETLEQGVKDTVQDAKEAVSDTIESVKDTVKDTVETVKNALDIKPYVERHPWPMVAGSVALGWVLGRMFLHSAKSYKVSNGVMNRSPQIYEPRSPNVTMEEANQPRGGLNSWFEKFKPEIGELEGIAIGAAGALVRDLIKQSAAEPLAERLEDVANRVTSKLGGKVIQEPLLAGPGAA